MTTGKIVSYPEVDAEHVGRRGCLGTKERRLISEEDGAKNFHARMIEILPSGLIPPHQHEHEHCAFILKGECTIICGGKIKTAKEGSAIFMAANTMHSWHNKTNNFITFLLVDT